MRRRHGPPTITIALVAAGGALGALARYGVARLLPVNGTAFPWATFWVNLSGSIALGVLLTLLVERVPRGRMARPLLGTGLIGAYTTFSTFTVESVLLVRNGRPGVAVVYVLASVAAGLIAAAAGIAATRSLVRVRQAGTRMVEQ